MRTAAFLALALALVVSSCQKKEASPEKSVDQVNVEELTKTYFELMQNGHWDLIATIFHPDSLSEFRATLDFLDSPSPYPQVPQIRAVVFGEGATEESVKALPDQGFFGKTLSFLMRQTTESGILKQRELSILGSIADGDDAMHVLAKSRVPMENEVRDVVEVVSYRKDGTSWKVLMTGKMRDNVIRLRNQLESANAQPGAQPAPPAPQQQ